MNVRQVAFIIVALIAGFVAGGLSGVFNTTPAPNPSAAFYKDTQQEYGTSTPESLTNPLLDCADLPTAISDAGMLSLNKDYNTYIAQETGNNDLITASVYYRDLNDGPWTSVNQSQAYSPASILKTPLAIGIYKRAEANPDFLTQKVKYVPIPSLAADAQPYAPTENVVAGKSYSVTELVRIMLQQSSNEAAVTLAGLQNPSDITGTYTDLGIPPPTFGSDYLTTVRQIASFFRILYNATYLTRDDSNTILSELTKAGYTDGLVAGVPANIVVAHKFGSRSDTDGSIELSDCGIIYYPGNPYILCVMTHGSDFPTLSKVIAHLSQLTYTYVQSGR